MCVNGLTVDTPTVIFLTILDSYFRRRGRTEWANVSETVPGALMGRGIGQRRRAEVASGWRQSVSAKIRTDPPAVRT